MRVNNRFRDPFRPSCAEGGIEVAWRPVQKLFEGDEFVRSHGMSLILLADDIAPLRRARGWALDWMARRRPHWFAGASGRGGATGAAGSKESGYSPEPPPPAGD